LGGPLSLSGPLMWSRSALCICSLTPVGQQSCTAPAGRRRPSRPCDPRVVASSGLGPPHRYHLRLRKAKACRQHPEWVLSGGDCQLDPSVFPVDVFADPKTTATAERENTSTDRPLNDWTETESDGVVGKTMPLQPTQGPRRTLSAGLCRHRPPRAVTCWWVEVPSVQRYFPRAWPDQSRFRNALFMAAPSSTQKPTHLMLSLHLAPDMQTGIAWTSGPVLAGPL
jgi:hypothetical protein